MSGGRGAREIVIGLELSDGACIPDDELDLDGDEDDCSEAGDQSRPVGAGGPGNNDG